MGACPSGRCQRGYLIRERKKVISRMGPGTMNAHLEILADADLLNRVHAFEGPTVSEPIQLECPHCSAQLRVRDTSILGKRVRCPKCKNPFATPEASYASDEAAAHVADEDGGFLSGLGSIEDEYGSISQPTLPAPRPRRRPTPGEEYQNPRPDTLPPRKKKKKRKRARFSGDGLPVILWPVCGLAGGAVGGVIWVLVAYLAHLQIGIIAWAVGGLTGLAVAMAAGSRAATGSGILAAVLAFGMILISKFAVAVLFVNQFAGQMENAKERQEQIIIQEARTLAEEQEKKGVKLDWPRGKSLDEAEELSDFPAPIAQQAQKNWDAQNPRIKGHLQNMQQINRIGKAFAIGAVFLVSFGLFDLLWFFLAISSAFKLGRGMT